MYNQEIAHSEGWGVFHTDTGRIQVQALDEASVFEDDFEAWMHVVKQARAGSEMHIDALNMVDDNERLDIIAACGWYKKPWMEAA